MCSVEAAVSAAFRRSLRLYHALPPNGNTGLVTQVPCLFPRAGIVGRSDTAG
jgi:hypothetical protein